MIDVEQDEGQHRVGAAPALARLFEASFKCAAIEQAGQEIRLGHGRQIQYQAVALRLSRDLLAAVSFRTLRALNIPLISPR